MTLLTLDQLVSSADTELAAEKDNERQSKIFDPG